MSIVPEQIIKIFFDRLRLKGRNIGCYNVTFYYSFVLYGIYILTENIYGPARLFFRKRKAMGFLLALLERPYSKVVNLLRSSSAITMHTVLH